MTSRTAEEIELLTRPEADYRALAVGNDELKNSGNDESKNISSGDDERRGYVLVLFAAVVYKFMGLLAREVTLNYGISVPNMIFIRGFSLLCMSLISATLVIGTNKVFNVPQPRSVLPLVALRGFVGGSALSLGYKALSLLPLGITNSIFFINPITTMLLSNFLIGERVSARECIAAAVSISGVVLVANPSFNTSPTANMHAIGIMCSLVSSVGASLSYVTVRAIGRRAHVLLNVMSFAICTMLIGFALGGARLHGLTQGVGLALLSSLFGFMGQVAMTRAFQLCRASTGALLRTVDVPIAYMLGLVFLNEVPHVVSLIGSVLVLCGAVIVGLNAVRRS